VCVCVCVWMSRYHERMSLTPTDQTVMSSTHLPFALRQCVYDVNNATSHAAVSRALCRLRWYLVVTTPVPPVLQHLNSVLWRPAIARYVSCVLCCASTHPLDGAGTGGIVYSVCPSHLCLQTCICVCSGTFRWWGAWSPTNRGHSGQAFYAPSPLAVTVS